eukprot:XP_025007815.1 maestro heat-like repeat-containing protein family member 2A [Gallus gallus]
MLGPGSKQHQRQLLCSFLPGLFACVGCVPRGTRRRERQGGKPCPCLCRDFAAAAPARPGGPGSTLAWRAAPREEGQSKTDDPVPRRAQAYCELEHVLWEGDSRPPCGVVNRLLAEVSQDLTAAQGVPDSVRTAASNVLVALARTHFTLVMAELQGHLKAVGEMSKEFVLVTLSKLFSSYAPQCISFVWLMLAGLRSVVGWVRGGRTLRIACAVVKQWLEGVKVHLGSGKQCPWPATEIEQIYKNLSQLFCSVLRNWQDCQEER